jgi:hypothetical protein
MYKKSISEKISYIKLITDISHEVGIPITDSEDLVDTAIILINPKEINYVELKEEILSYIVINIFSLVCKL